MEKLIYALTWLGIEPGTSDMATPIQVVFMVSDDVGILTPVDLSGWATPFRLSSKGIESYTFS